MHPKPRNRVQGLHPLCVLAEGTPCHEPFPSPVPWPPLHAPAPVHYPAHTGKPSFFFLYPPEDILGFGVTAFFIDLGYSLYVSTHLLNCFLFLMVISLFLDPLTVVFCPLLP